jgi:hypothetical protein
LIITLSIEEIKQPFYLKGACLCCRLHFTKSFLTVPFGGLAILVEEKAQHTIG